MLTRPIGWGTLRFATGIPSFGPAAFGRILWGEAKEYPQKIRLRSAAKPAGLFHLRIT